MNLRPRSRPHRHVLLDMTPLIDVVFLLLIFFMVSTTFERQSEIKIELPEISAEAPDQPELKPMSITIDAEGHYFIEDRPIADLKALQQALAPKDKNHPILINADKQAPFEAVMGVMDVAARLDMNHLRFIGQWQPAE